MANTNKETIDALGSDNNAKLLSREITWKDGFWIVSGGITGVLLSIGSTAATLGPPSWAIWAAATLLTFAHLFIYAEMSGMFPQRSGGTAVYAAIALKKYGKIFAPLNVWCSWLGWAPSPAIVVSIAGSYIVTGFFSDTSFARFSWVIADLSSFLPGIVLQVNSTILSGMFVLLVAFYLQHSGVLRMARTQFLLTTLSFIPIFLLAVVPLVTGKINWSNFQPFLLEGTTSWFSSSAFTLLMGGMFICLWSTFTTEAAMFYVSEFKNPAVDTIRTAVSSGFAAFLAFTVLPFTFLGVLGMSVLKDPSIVSGNPQVAVVKMAETTFGIGMGKWVTIMLIIAMTLVAITCMSSSSRTLYQSAIEGWLPSYLSDLNKHKVPTKAMWTDLCFNLFLLLLGNPIFVLAASNVAYLFGIILNLIGAFIHRIDRPSHYRPYKAPNWLMYYGVPVLVILDLAFIIFGANVFDKNALLYGVIGIITVFPIFYYRHYVVDRGIWPTVVKEDL